ncbi:hypothetical protein SDC9_158586 [bioreactor metagenome]|uniref:Uncharacterized protein n=1 Tax=bioreactor metagenome TaxID=1076179 RepID=A0A645FA77_9ZZZZ
MNREEGGESSQVKEVGNGGSQVDGEDLAILGGSDIERIREALDAVKHVGIV